MEGFLIFLILVVVFALDGLLHHRRYKILDELLPEQPHNSIKYYLKRTVSGDRYELSLSVPDEFPRSVSDFELWADDQIIGDRTSIYANLENIVLNKDLIQKLSIRLYNYCILVADFSIDIDAECGELIID